MASTDAETPQIVEREAVVSEGAPLNAQAQAAGVAAWLLRKGGDGRLWLGTDGGLAAFSNNALTSVLPRPSGDYVEGVGVASDGTIIVRLRNARVLQRIDAAGHAIGAPYALPAGMKGGEFADGPDGETWLPSFNKAVAIALPASGAPRRLSCRSCFGLAHGPDDLMWGVEAGLFAVDAGGEERRRLYFEVAQNESRPIVSGGEIWFCDTAGDGRARLNQFDRDRLLTRHRLPHGIELLGIVAGTQGSFWLWGLRGGQALVARVDAGGAILAHALTGGVQVPRDMVVGHDGRLWVIDLDAPGLFAAAV
jgi:streptogramin lyase